jgi:hypothetical protein
LRRSTRTRRKPVRFAWWRRRCTNEPTFPPINSIHFILNLWSLTPNLIYFHSVNPGLCPCFS